MQAHGALIKFARIENPVYGFKRVDRTRVLRIHLHDFGGLDGRLARGNVLVNHMRFSTSKRPLGTAIQQFWSR